MRRINRNLKFKISKILDDVFKEMNEELYNWVTDHMLEMDEARIKEDLKRYFYNSHESQVSRDKK
ncbi:MAG: hypothetical protein H0S79_13735 [Anaerolineaceae bacterium]|nr:hypothetical protein [Anaerolineaceae bacterium]